MILSLNSTYVTTLCGNYQEKTGLVFSKNYYPFNQVEIPKKDSELKRKNLSTKDCIVLSNIQNELITSDAKFNDTETLETFKRFKQAETLMVQLKRMLKISFKIIIK